MVAVVQVNFVVVDLERSRDFWHRLGVTFRERRRAGMPHVQAWVSTNADVPIVLHSSEFASWWDPNTPGPVAGGSQIDLELRSSTRLDALVADLERSAVDRGRSGTTIAKQPADMPWGQRFAIVLDPDGYRIGLKAPLATTE